MESIASAFTIGCNELKALVALAPVCRNRAAVRFALIVALGGSLSASKSNAAPGDWPEPRQNACLTAFQPLAGGMKTAPRQLAAIDLGRQDADLIPVTRPDGTTVGLYLAAGALQCWDTDGRLLWQTHPPGLNFTQFVATEDLDGDQHLEVVLQAGRSAQPYGAAVMVSLDDGRLLWRYDVDPVSYTWYLYTGHYLPGSDRKQIIVVMQGYPPDEGFGFVALFACARPGALPTQRWRYDFDHYTCFPGLFRVDVDGDGIEELALETHSHMWILDPFTGEPKQYLEWDVSPANVRSYGLNRFIDVNGDGREDFVVIANFAQHHEILLNQDGRFVKAWHHGWDENVTTGKIKTTWPEPPIADVDGDGRQEMVVSMYNSEGENSWLIRVYDAVDGRLKYRLPGMSAVGLHDLDGDGRAEVLANTTTDPGQTRLDGAQLLTVKDGELVPVWSDPDAVAVKCEPMETEDKVRPRSDGQPLVLSSAESLPLIRRAASPGSEAQVLYRVSLTGEQEVVGGAASGEQEVVGGAASGVPSVALGQIEGRELAGIPWQPRSEAPTVTWRNQPRVLGRGTLQLLAADLDGDGRNELVTWGSRRCRVYRMREGRMERGGAYDSDALPAMGDFDGDGRLDIALVRLDPSQTPIIEVRTPSLGDQLLWRTQLPPPVQLTLAWSRRAYLRVGRFTGREAPDLYLFAGVPVVRSLVLQGGTGRVVWEKTEMEEIHRYWGPTVNLAAACDTNGNGRDELVFTNPDYYCVADGTTGDLNLGPLFPPAIFSQPSQGLYTMPVVLDSDGARPTVCLVGGHYFQAAMSPAAAPYWYALPPAGEARCSDEGFLRNRDGRWLMGFGRQNGRFACLEVANGRLRWELPVDASCTDVVTCDIDGDGDGEFLFGTSHGDLFAVADEGDHPRVLWRQAPGAPASGVEGASAVVGSPIVADLNGDGHSEIIIQTADGRIHVLGVG